MKRTFLYPHGVHTNANPATLFRGEKEAELSEVKRWASFPRRGLETSGPSVTVVGVLEKLEAEGGR